MLLECEFRLNNTQQVHDWTGEYPDPDELPYCIEHERRCQYPERDGCADIAPAGIEE